jgi:integrase
MAFLKAGLNHAHQRRRLASADAWHSLKPFRQVQAPRVRYLSQDEARALIAAITDEPFRNLVIGALMTGCRYGELAAARVRDFDPNSGALYIPRSKSGKPRHVFLSDEGTRFFTRILQDKAHKELVFVRTDKEAWAQAHQHRLIKAASAEAKINPAISFHILRHTYASTLAMRRVPMRVIADQLGHADTRMTERHYAHLASSFIAAEIRRAMPALQLNDEDLADAA